MSVGPRRQCFSPQAHDKCAPTAERRERQHEKCTPTGCIPAQEKRPPRRCPGQPVVTTLWSDDRTAGVADEERGHAEIRHGQHDARLLAGQDGTSPVLLDGFAHGTAPLGRVGGSTHRNVVDRGRPYAPFPNRTTPFLEFVGESSTAARAPPGYPVCRPFLTADELAHPPPPCHPRLPARPPRRTRPPPPPSGLGRSGSGDLTRPMLGRLAHFSPRGCAGPRRSGRSTGAVGGTG